MWLSLICLNTAETKKEMLSEELRQASKLIFNLPKYQLVVYMMGYRISWCYVIWSSVTVKYLR